MGSAHPGPLSPVSFDPTVQSLLVWGFRDSLGLLSEGSLSRAGLGGPSRRAPGPSGCHGLGGCPHTAPQTEPHHPVVGRIAAVGRCPPRAQSAGSPGVCQPDSPESRGPASRRPPRAWQAATGRGGRSAKPGLVPRPLQGGSSPGSGRHGPPAPGVLSAQGSRCRQDWTSLRVTVSGRPASRLLARGAAGWCADGLEFRPHHDKSCALGLERCHLPSLGDVGEMHLTGPS